MNRNGLMVPRVTPTVTCNARTPEGFCKNIAGFKTEFKSGRCVLHRSPGRTPALTDSDDRAGAVMKVGLWEHYEKVKNDPQLRGLDNEVAILRTLLEKTLFQLPDVEDDNSWYLSEDCTDKLKEIRMLADSIGKLFSKLTDAEEKKKRVLSIGDLMKFITKVGDILNTVCKGCPKRDDISKKIMEVDIENAEFEETT